MPEATFTHTVDSGAPPEAAWEALQNPDTWSSIGPVSSVSNPTFTDDGRLTGFDWIADVGGKGYRGTAKAGPFVPLQRFTMMLDTSEIAGDVVATITEGNPQTAVTVAITFRTKGMLSAMFFPAIKTALSSGFPKQVEDLVGGI